MRSGSGGAQLIKRRNILQNPLDAYFMGNDEKGYYSVARLF